MYPQTNFSSDMCPSFYSNTVLISISEMREGLLSLAVTKLLADWPIQLTLIFTILYLFHDKCQKLQTQKHSSTGKSDTKLPSSPLPLPLPLPLPRPIPTSRSPSPSTTLYLYSLQCIVFKSNWIKIIWYHRNHQQHHQNPHLHHQNPDHNQKSWSSQ